MFNRAWPDAPTFRRDSLLAAIQSAAQSAAAGQLAPNIEEADDRATRTVGVLQLSGTGYLKDNRDGCPRDPNMALLASHAAVVAAKATETAIAIPGESFEIAMEGFSWALVVFEDDPSAVETMRSEFKDLELAATRGKWSHRTPVSWHEDHWVAGHSETKPWWKFW